MALVVADRVQETTTTTGTGTYTLSGAKDGFQSFAAVGNGNTTYYACTDGTDYEVGIGTYTLSGTTLARTTIIESSNSDAAVNWGAGEKDIFVTLPSSKALVKDSGDDFVLADGEKLRFGNGPDLTIYHNGTESIILDEGTGPLRIRTPQFIVSNFGATETQIQTDQNAGVKLFYDNAEKFETVSGGIDITGNIAVSGTVDGVDIATNIPSSLGTAGQVLTVNAGATAGEWADVGGNLELYSENPSSPTAPSATGTNAVAIGSGASAATSQSYAIGFNAVTATNSGAMALGNSYASGTDSFAAAITSNSASYGATGANSIAIGTYAKATSTSAVAIGRFPVATSGESATAIGKSYASGTDSFAAAISNNTSSYGAIGANSIAIGNQAKANGSNALAFGGWQNLVTNSLAVALGGYDNHATGIAAVSIGGNQGNRATGNASFCIGGYQSANTASDDNSFAMGEGAKSAVKGKLAYAGGAFAAAGDAQGGQFILRADTTDATATVLTTNNSTAGSTNQIVAASDTCITFDGTITAMQNGAQAYASWRIEGLLVNDGGTTTLANSATTVISNLSSWGMALSADNTNNALAITCTGEASHNVRWVANIRTTEVTYA
jgi:hypothetical protein